MLSLPGWLHEQGDAILLDVIVSPRSSRDRVIAVFDERLKIQLTAPPVDNKANEALVRFIAEQLDVARAQVEIVGGTTNRRKTVRVLGVPVSRVVLRLLPHRS